MCYQQKCKAWALECFGEGIVNDKLERVFRFLEESLELAQSLGVSQDQVEDLVNYVFERQKGEPTQELGGVMVTIAVLSEVHGLDMQSAGEVELNRVLGKIDQIRAKHNSKPKNVLSSLLGKSLQDASNS